MHPGWSMAGQKNLAPPYYNQRAVFATVNINIVIRYNYKWKAKDIPKLEIPEVHNPCDQLLWDELFHQLSLSDNLHPILQQ